MYKYMYFKCRQDRGGRGTARSLSALYLNNDLARRIAQTQQESPALREVHEEVPKMRSP